MPRKPKPASPPQTLVPEKNRCHFTTIDGRQCRMHRAKGHKTLCLVHGEQEAQILDAEAVAEELIGPVTKFQTALELNHALGHLFTLVAQKRISRHDGALLGFVAQLLHNNVGSTVKAELGQIEGSNTPPYWENNVRRALAHLQFNMSTVPSEPSLARSEPRPSSAQPPGQSTVVRSPRFYRQETYPATATKPAVTFAWEHPKSEESGPEGE